MYAVRRKYHGAKELQFRAGSSSLAEEQRKGDLQSLMTQKGSLLGKAEKQPVAMHITSSLSKTSASSVR